MSMKTPAGPAPKAGKPRHVNVKKLTTGKTAKPRRKASVEPVEIPKPVLPLKRHGVVPFVLSEFRDKWIKHTEQDDFADKLESALDDVNGDGIGFINLDGIAMILDRVKFTKDITSDFNTTRFFFLAMRLLNELTLVSGKDAVREEIPADQAAELLCSEWNSYRRFQRV